MRDICCVCAHSLTTASARTVPYDGAYVFLVGYVFINPDLGKLVNLEALFATTVGYLFSYKYTRDYTNPIQFQVPYVMPLLLRNPPLLSTVDDKLRFCRRQSMSAHRHGAVTSHVDDHLF